MLSMNIFIIKAVLNCNFTALRTFIFPMKKFDLNSFQDLVLLFQNMILTSSFKNI